MAFTTQIAAFNATAKRQVSRAFHIATEEVKRSLVDGSEITGAPGQPVDQFILRPSFIDGFVSPTLWQVTTDKLYAKFIEAGATARGPLTLRSKVGGFHSKELTEDGWPAIVRHAVREARRA